MELSGQQPSPKILTYLTLTTCNLGMVTPMQHFLVSKESSERGLSFGLNIKFIESSVQNFWSSKLVTTKFP